MGDNANVDSFIADSLNSEKEMLRFAKGADRLNPIEKDTLTSHFIFSQKFDEQTKADQLNPNK